MAELKWTRESLLSCTWRDDSIGAGNPGFSPAQDQDHGADHNKTDELQVEAGHRCGKQIAPRIVAQKLDAKRILNKAVHRGDYLSAEAPVSV